ncbi:putative six-hairpin glycosidase [Rosellinia necatrix]|uniref:Putative six-hairpin glycosidase n=1 Tax=Rosellinia necatrix TaxID=77044 RepID=A0A1W2TPL6_ROSNE|nr:putative six-hairpin glycosidase [Rosellinia necatrix]
MAVSLSAALITFSGLAYTVLAGQGARAARGTLFLDHEGPLSGFQGRSFLRDNIPFIDIPDKLIQDVYYYRWTSLQRNLRYVTAGTGYMCTEFIHPVGYAKAFGTIDAAAGHQIDESRWLRDTSYGDDYIQIYTRGPADPLQYTQWILDAASRRAMVTGDNEFLATQLQDMIRVWHLWDHVFDSNAGLFYYQPVWDAQELSLPGFIADPDNTNWDLRKDGPDTYRPSHNAYMVANARAIARAAGLVHDSATQSEFTKIADDLEAAMFKHLWAPEQEFFMDIIRPNNPDLTRLTGREQVGLFPYRFGIGLNESYAQPALDSMFDPMGFFSTYGPTTLEIRDPWFFADRPDNYCCWWNGQSWPYSTGHTLKSLAAIYRSGVTNATAEQYHQYLQIYAGTQQKDGKPYVAESHAPFDDIWTSDGRNHSEHYDHSTYNDDVITGLLGILPQPDDTLHISPIIPSSWNYFALENLPYHGHLVTILYDKDGSRYKMDTGLSVFVDGQKVHNGPDTSAVVPIPAPVLPGDALINIAANPDGPGQYPTADATFTYPADYSYKAIDGVVYYDQVPDNRWTDYTSPNKNDTLTVHFARPRKVSSVTLALFSDVARGGSVDLPGRIEIYGSGGPITSVNSAAGLLANDKNVITFNEVETTFIAVNMYRSSATTWVGVCEIEVWTPPVAGPTYFAVDAHLTGSKTQVQFDAASRATTNGAVVGGIRSDSDVGFSGIKSDGKAKMLTLSYANPGSSIVTVNVLVNQVQRATLQLVPTAGRYGTVSAALTLAVGKNYVSIHGGSDTAAVRYETLKIA